MSGDERQRLKALADDWKQLAVALKQDSLCEWGETSTRLAERSEVYAECAGQLERRIKKEST